jgi:beta-N-acetylhexosaminidase
VIAGVGVLALSHKSAPRIRGTAIDLHHAPQLARPRDTPRAVLPAGEVAARAGSGARERRAPRQLSLKKAVGQLLIGTYTGGQPPASILNSVRAGHLGAIILMGANTAGGAAATHAATNKLQAAARAGRNPGLLIMTDQEGGEVKRLAGAPAYSAAGMTDANVARQQGTATAELLRQAGINVDLAPVADVTRIDGFMTQEHRTFGSDTHGVARAACAFAHALARSGVAYTLKHFPGLGGAIANTDGVPVSVSEPASEITADDAPYRECGHGSLALVMVSSASYDQLTGSTPAVLSPSIYHTVMARDGIDAVTISDSFQSGAISAQRSPASKAINAGLDMVMYPDDEAASRNAYKVLVHDAEHGSLDAARVRDAAKKVLTLKAHLGLR